MRARLNRRRLMVALFVAGSVVVLGGGVLWALPEIIRRTAVAQFPKLTGRVLSIEDIDLNLFTGRLVLKKLRVSERDPSETFVQAESIGLRLLPFSVITGNLVLSEVILRAPQVRIVRTGPAEFNFSDLLARIPPSDPNEPKGDWTLTIGRLALIDGAVLIGDHAVSPVRNWRFQGIAVEAGGLSTRAAQRPGHVAVRARVNEAALDANADDIVLTSGGLTVHVGLHSFDLTQVRPYLPPDLPVSLQSGSLGLSLQVTVEQGEEGLKRAMISGDVSLEKLALAQPDHPAPFFSLPRLSIGIESADLIASSITLKSLEVEGFELRAVRDQAGTIDLQTLASGPSTGPAGSEPVSPPEPAKTAPTTPAKKPFKAKLEQLTVRSGTIALNDQAVSPAREWRLQGLTVDGGGLSTSADDAPGTVKVSARLGGMPDRPPATVSVDATSLRLSPLAATARVAIEGFDLGTLGPYWPASLPAVVGDGALGFDVNATVERGATELTRAVASASARLAGLTLVRRGQSSAPFLTVPKLTVDLKQADALARTVALGRIAIEGVDARAIRDAAGQIDLLEVLAAGTGGPPPAAPAPAKPAGSAAPRQPEWRISLDRFDFTKGTAAFEDHAVSPTTVLPATDLTVSAQQVVWPSTSPASFTASVSMPGGGRTEVKGKGQLEPLNVQIAMSTRDAPIAPYQAYFPFPARFVGFFSGDSLSEIQRLKNGTLVLASRGHAWARDFEVRAPGVDAPVAKLAQMDIQGIDFSWPNYTLVDRVVLTKPEAQVERDANGVINLQRLFAQERPESPKAAPASPAPVTGAAGKPSEGGPLEELVLDFKEFTSVDGYVRFLDRTTTPPFSIDLSDFTVTVRGASTPLGRQPVTLTARAKVGGAGTLDVQAQVSGVGNGRRVDLTGDVQDFALPATNPYVEKLTSWIISKGKFSLRTHYQVEGDQLSAEHDMKFAGLRVEHSHASDQGQQRLGVPLGLAVALLKDRHGDIDFSIPLHGTLSDQKFDWSEAMWAGARQVIVKLVVSPFNAIGRAITGGGDSVEKLEIDPVTFAAASSVIAPPMEVHLTRVADFLRRAPSLALTLRPVLAEADVNALKAREVKARLELLQRERSLRDLAEATTVYATERLPGVTLPENLEERLALLSSRESVPEGTLEDLLKARVDATRDRLIKAEGISAERLSETPPSSAAPAAASGDGRVEFGLGAGDE